MDFSDPAVQFGSGGAFETLRVEARRPHLFEAHWARLLRTLEFLQLDPPPDREPILSLISREIGRFSPDAGLRLRLTVGLDPHPPRTTGRTPIRAFAEARPLDPAVQPPVPDRPPLRLHLFPDYGLSANDPWNTHKTTRYFAHAEARRRAVTRGFDEALFLNEFGNVVEASAHNLFWIKDACLFSPPSDAGGLPGTFAAYVRRIATDLGIRHLTANAWIGEVRTADTLFLTNAVGEIRKVSILDDLTIAPLEDSDVGRLVLERVEADRDLRADSDLTFHI